MEGKGGRERVEGEGGREEGEIEGVFANDGLNLPKIVKKLAKRAAL